MKRSMKDKLNIVRDAYKQKLSQSLKKIFISGSS